METHVTLPQWLDDYIFKELGAKYCRSNADMTVIDWDKRDMLNYLGTYFPRSYAEARCIFGDYFHRCHPSLLDKEEIRVFDFGCGTGGEIVGLAESLQRYSTSIKKLNIYAFDGNYHALNLCERILKKVRIILENIEIEYHIIPLTIEDFYDMSVLESVIKVKFDIIMTFKAICEFVAKERFEEKNPYLRFVEAFSSKLEDRGIMVVEDVTSKSDVTQEWLPHMMDNGLSVFDCRITHKNDGYNHAIHVAFSHNKGDITKVAWRIITNNNQ